MIEEVRRRWHYGGRHALQGHVAPALSHCDIAHIVLAVADAIEMEWPGKHAGRVCADEVVDWLRERADGYAVPTMRHPDGDIGGGGRVTDAPIANCQPEGNKPGTQSGAEMAANGSNGRAGQPSPEREREREPEYPCNHCGEPTLVSMRSAEGHCPRCVEP